jgi:transcriptional antiterminator RfaH
MWYVVQTKPNQEFFAAQNLLNQFFEVYLPIVNIKKYQCKKIIDIKKPLFSGYLFVFLKNINENWHKINFTRGIKKIIQLGETLLPIDKNFINFLKSKEINGKIFLSDLKKIKNGDKYFLNNKIFKKILCEIDSVIDKNRVKVFLNILGRETRLTVSKIFLEPCTSV